MVEELSSRQCCEQTLTIVEGSSGFFPQRFENIGEHVAFFLVERIAVFVNFRVGWRKVLDGCKDGQRFEDGLG